jgi:recombination protein RecA
MTSADRLKMIEELKNELNDKVGERFITSLVDTDVLDIDVISTGVPTLDLALGVGGIPRGRISEIYGPEQSGKSTLAVQCAANMQIQGGVTIYVDGENALDPAYCKALGLNPEDPSFIIVQPDYGEQGLNTITEFMKLGLVDLVILDSIASLTPKAKLLGLAGDISIEGNYAESDSEKKSANKADMDDFSKFVGLQARMYAGFCGYAPQLVRKHNVALLGLNQIRTGFNKYGSYQTRPGGNAWFHAVSTRIEVYRLDTKNEGGEKSEELIGLYGVTKAHIKKNKVGVPHRQALFDLVFGQGADYYSNLLTVCGSEKIGIKKNGGWFQPIDENGDKLGKAMYLKDLVPWFLENEEGRRQLQTMVDELGSRNGIVLFDPTRPERRIGPMEHAIDIHLSQALEETDFDQHELTAPEDLEVIDV